MERVRLEDVLPLLSQPLPSDEHARAEAAVSMMWAVLEGRYQLSTRVDADGSLREAVVYIMAVAFERRQDKPVVGVLREASGPFSVQWSETSTTGAWFLPSELSDMDKLFKSAGSRTYRTQAPDAIAYGNRLHRYEDDDVFPW